MPSFLILLQLWFSIKCLTFSDEDECSGEGSGDNCSSNAVCTNNEGGFACKCKNGWSGDGMNCTGIYIHSTFTFMDLHNMLKHGLFKRNSPL